MNYKNSDAVFIENALTLLTGGTMAAAMAVLMIILA